MSKKTVKARHVIYRGGGVRIEPGTIFVTEGREYDVLMSAKAIVDYDNAAIVPVVTETPAAPAAPAPVEPPAAPAAPVEPAKPAKKGKGKAKKADDDTDDLV